MKKSEIKRIKYLFVSFIVSICLIFYYVFLRSNVSNNAHNTRFYIAKNSTFKEIYKSLKKKKILKSNFSFFIASKFFIKNNNFRTGSYILKKSYNNLKILRFFRLGLQKPIKLVLNNINTKQELIEKVCAKLAMNKNELKKILNDNTLINKYGFNRDNILAMFIPNTYEIYWNIKPKIFIKKMYKEYIIFWNTKRRYLAKKINLSIIDVSILASLVESETLIYDEAPIIAGVYRNRLKKKMRLMSDPTLKFANKIQKAKRILLKDCKVDSKFNTYKLSGLPPGPIKCPKISFIDAVLNLKKHNYLYLCAKDDFSGSHNFSHSFKEHLKYARKYWKSLNKCGIYR